MMTSSNGNIFRVTGHLCGEFPGPGEFPAQRPVTRNFDVFFDLRLNKGWWFETLSCSLWRHINGWIISPMQIDVNTDHAVTYNELFRRAFGFARGLRERGFRQGDRYMMFSPNTIDSAVAILGVMAVGGIFTGINPGYTKGEWNPNKPAIIGF